MFENRDRLRGTEPKSTNANGSQSVAAGPIILSVFLKAKADLPVPVKNAEHLTRTELMDKHGPRETDFYRVLEFAHHFGLVVHSSSLDQRIVRLQGSRQAMEQAFDVRLRSVRVDDKTVTVRTGPIMIPVELTESVSAVFGLDSRPVAKPHFRRTKSRKLLGKPDGFDGQQLAAIYGLPDSTGSGQTIGLIELGGGYTQFDLDTFFASLNLPAPSVKSVSVMGGVNAPVIDQGADTEVALDIEVAGAVSPGAKIVVYFAPNDEQGFFEAVSAAIHDTVNQVDIISISWGAAEAQWSGQMLNSMSQLFQTAAALGISVFVAAGDDGANDNGSDGKAHVDFPASSPWVTACGGTTLVLNDSARTETAWNSSADGTGATGGGISSVFAVPDYQQTVSMPPNLNGGPGRGLPDVAAVADPQTPYAVFVDGSWTDVGGTSAVAPFFAGLLARINSLQSKRIGFINPHIFSGAGVGFNDITVGNNSTGGVVGYSAGTGWDAVTGFGSPNGAQLLEILSQPADGA